MNDLQKGDIIKLRYLREEVLARLEDLVFTRELFESGAVGPVRKATEIKELVDYGWEVEPPQTETITIKGEQYELSTYSDKHRVDGSRQATLRLTAPTKTKGDI